MVVSEVAKRIVEGIMLDLTDRRGIKHAIETVDEEVSGICVVVQSQEVVYYILVLGLLHEELPRFL